MRILYVEDNPANLFLVQRVARMGNHDVVNYAEGQPALDNFKTDKPDLVLMDIQLSGILNGLDVVKALRAAGHKTPIIAVTAYAMAGDREKCIEAGCDGYLSKPLPVGELVELFKRYQPTSTAEVAAVASPAPAAVTDVKPEPAPESKPTAPVQPATTPANVAPAAETRPIPNVSTPVEPVKAAVAPVPPPVVSAPVPEPEVKTPAPTTASAQPPAAVEPSKESAPVQPTSAPTETPKDEASATNPAAAPAVKPAENSPATDPLTQQGVSKEKDEKISLESKQS